MAENRLQRLLTHGDDDVDTYMSPLRGEAYPLKTWAVATNAIEEKTDREKRIGEKRLLADIGGKLAPLAIGAGGVTTPAALLEAAAATGSPLRLKPPMLQYVSPVSQHGSDLGGQSPTNDKMRGALVVVPDGQFMLSDADATASVAARNRVRGKGRFGVTVDDDDEVDPPILLCTGSSLLDARKEPEWGRTTRTGMHNLIRDYGPTSEKNAAIRRILDEDAVDMIQSTVSGKTHRAQLYADIPTNSKTHLSDVIAHVASAEAEDPSTTYFPSAFALARKRAKLVTAIAEDASNNQTVPQLQWSTTRGASVAQSYTATPQLSPAEAPWQNPYEGRMKKYLGTERASTTTDTSAIASPNEIRSPNEVTVVSPSSEHFATNTASTSKSRKGQFNASHFAATNIGTGSYTGNFSEASGNKTVPMPSLPSAARSKSQLGMDLLALPLINERTTNTRSNRSDAPYPTSAGAKGMVPYDHSRRQQVGSLSLQGARSPVAGGDNSVGTASSLQMLSARDGMLSVRETALHFRQHGIRAGIVADPQRSAMLSTTPTTRLSEEQMLIAMSTINYPERYRELAMLQDQQAIRAEIYEGFRRDYDNHVEYIGSVMTAMAEGNFTNVQHDKSLLIPTHSHKVLQLMSRLRRETVPIMFVKHDDDDSASSESGSDDEEDEDGDM